VSLILPDPTLSELVLGSVVGIRMPVHMALDIVKFVEMAVIQSVPRSLE
jgi:hypothetical protein